MGLSLLMKRKRVGGKTPFQKKDPLASSMLPSFPCRISWVPRQSGLLHCLGWHVPTLQTSDGSDMRPNANMFAQRKTDRRPHVARKFSLYADDVAILNLAFLGFQRSAIRVPNETKTVSTELNSSNTCPFYMFCISLRRGTKFTEPSS